MAIIIPEILIKKNLDILIKKVYTDLTAQEQTGTVVDASDNGTGVTVATTQQGAVGTPEITQLTLVDFATITDGYILLNTPSIKFFIWFDKGDGTTTKPNIIDKKEIRVFIASEDTAIDVATKTATELQIHTDYFSVPNAVTATLTITNVETDATKRSLLYNIFGDLSFDGLSYFTQMGLMLKNTFQSEVRGINIYLGYNINREEFPMINILLPSEENEPKHIGNVQGEHNFYDGTFAGEKENSFQVTYNLMITSDNENDVIILYHFLKTLMLMGYEQFTTGSQFHNLYFSGRDIMLDFDIDPMNTYHRTLAMTFFYDNLIPDLNINKVATSINFTGTNTEC